MANVCRGMVAGMLAGCAAAWVMTTLGSPVEGQSKPQPTGGSAREEEELRGRRSDKRSSQNGGVAVEEPTVATAQVISKQYFKHELSDSEKKIAGPAVHYAYGSLVGALYGGLTEIFPSAGMGFGLPFGAALWLLGDEIAVPALGLGKGASEVPADKHADALASHFCYGITTDLMRRVLRHIV